MSMEFLKQEYWSGLQFPFPGDLPDPGIEPRSPALQADSLPSELSGKPRSRRLGHKKKEMSSGYGGVRRRGEALRETLTYCLLFSSVHLLLTLSCHGCGYLQLVVTDREIYISLLSRI